MRNIELYLRMIGTAPFAHLSIQSCNTHWPTQDVRWKCHDELHNCELQTMFILGVTTEAEA